MDTLGTYATADAVGGSYQSRIAETLDRIEYRLVTTAEDLEDVARLRYAAYQSRNIYPGRFDGPILEAVDSDPETFVFGLYHEGEIVSTMRIHKLTASNRDTPSMELYPEKINPLLDQGLRFIDPSRFAIDQERAAGLPGIHLLTIRLAHMATKHFRFDYCLSTVKKEHSAFYRRFFGCTQIAGPDWFPHMGVPAVMFMVPRSNDDFICRKWPFFRSTALERRMLFDPPQGGLAPLTVLPTARYAG